MLNGRCALITGSTSGIGLGIARVLAAQGCHVMLNGFGDPAAIDRARAALEADHRVKVRYHGADLTRPVEIADLVGTTVAELGSLDILVNNAGIQHTAPIEAFPPERWDAILATNLSAAFHAIRHVLPAMRRRGWGRIVNTASVHGLVGLTRTVALETAGSGITCNAICPGWTRTELVEPQIAARAKALGVSLDEGARDMLAEKQPSKQFVTVDQLGAVVAFLCSDAAAQITGTSIPVDGGWTSQ
jgi:3-hydroxybutyrate dehydrogenase